MQNRKEFSFDELSKKAQETAYRNWVQELVRDDLNWNMITSFDDYASNAMFDGLSFDISGNCVG
jgi:hypothetical protein